MRAAVLKGFSQPLVIEERPVPQPGAGEILVKVHAVGICGTDLKIWHGKKEGTPLPLIMGHEIAGEIAALGEGVDCVSIGMRGVVHFYCSCHMCELCQTNRETLCAHMDGRLGFTRDGGLREYLTVKADNFIEVGNDIPLDTICIVADAISTVYRGLRKANIQKGERVLVVGLGGLGTHAAQVARAMGGVVYGVDIDERKLAFAAEYGCSNTVMSAKNPMETAKRLLQAAGGGFDIIIETATRASTVAVDLRVLNPSGRIVVLGYGAGEISLDPYALVRQEIGIFGSRASSRQDVKDVLQMIASGEVRPAISKYYPLEDVNLALQALESGDLLGRQVIRMAESN